jgi:copper chaperone CopZ
MFWSSGPSAETSGRYCAPSVGGHAHVGVSKVDISLEDQVVKVDASIPYEEVEQAIKKTGKTVKSGKVIPPVSAAVA